MRYLVIAAAAFAATTSFASADSMPVATGPMQLSAAQLDEVTAGRRVFARVQSNRAFANSGNIVVNRTTQTQTQTIRNCTGGSLCFIIGGPQIAVTPTVAISAGNTSRVKQSH